ncbi:hypothetical protein GCM10009848_19090 [Micromonospora lupini]
MAHGSAGVELVCRQVRRDAGPGASVLRSDGSVLPCGAGALGVRAWYGSAARVRLLRPDGCGPGGSAARVGSAARCDAPLRWGPGSPAARGVDAG